MRTRILGLTKAQVMNKADGLCACNLRIQMTKSSNERTRMSGCPALLPRLLLLLLLQTLPSSLSTRALVN